MNIHRIIVGFLILIVGLFYFLTVREGFSYIWGGDFSLYILHAKNISEGKPYEHTGYIYNPSYPYLSPKTYPPVFPLLLTPVYMIFGLDFQAMKTIPIITFLLSLFFIYLNFKDKLPFYSVLSMLA